MPSGRLWAVNASNATAWIGIDFVGVPRTRNSPADELEVLLGASSWWAAIVLALSSTLLGRHVDRDAADGERAASRRCRARAG